MLEKATFIATINAGFTLQNMVFALKASFSIKITQTHLSEREREKYYNKVKMSADTQQLESLRRKDT